MSDNDATQTRQDGVYAIDELRRMLDKRGVEWKAKAFYFMDVGTVFSASYDFEWIAIWDRNANNLSITNYKNGLTPAQVIAATLGPTDAEHDIADMSENVRMLRCMAGDGSVEWVMEPIRASTLREIADALDENEKLRELLVGAYEDMDAWQKVIASSDQWGYGKGCLDRLCELRDAMRELGIEVPK